MTKPLDPEIKGLRALMRGFRLIPVEARHRCLEWLVNYHCGRSDIRLPESRRCHHA